MDEFDLIKHYFQQQQVQRQDVLLPIGDDAAVLACPSNQQLVVTMDTMVNAVHFAEYISAKDVGHKLAMVNVSDLAAMGAVPAWASLSLTMPAFDEPWLHEFCRGFFAVLENHQIQLIGGDCVKGPLSLTCQLTGFVPNGQALTRGGAEVGDIIVVSGELGDAGRKLARQQAHCPNARIALGQALRGVATAAIDISDGLLADCQHILQQSGVGAKIQASQLPLSDDMRAQVTMQQALQWALTAGEDYELCFCIPQQKQVLLPQLSKQFNVKLTAIGVITAEKALQVFNAQGQVMHFDRLGYKHF